MIVGLSVSGGRPRVSRYEEEVGRREQFPGTACNLPRCLRGARVPSSLALPDPLGRWRPPGSGSPGAPHLRPDPVAAARRDRLRGGNLALPDRRAVPVRDGRPLPAPGSHGHLRRGAGSAGGGDAGPTDAAGRPHRPAVRGNGLPAALRRRALRDPPGHGPGRALCAGRRDHAVHVPGDGGGGCRGRRPDGGSARRATRAGLRRCHVRGLRAAHQVRSYWPDPPRRRPSPARCVSLAAGYGWCSATVLSASC